MPFFKFDVARAVRHAKTVDFTPPRRGGTLRPTLEEVLSYITRIRELRQSCTLDIEGFADDVGVTMLSICTTPEDGIVIPFWLDGGNYWSEADEVLVWQAVAELLADENVQKKAHNAFYELFVLAWRHRCHVNNLHDDTMMKHWELFPDFAKSDKDQGKPKAAMTSRKRSLAVCASIYTEQPYYKGGRLSEDSEVKLRYNMTDSQVTCEIDQVTEKMLAKVSASLDHYRFNINLIPAYNYIMLRGCRFDFDKAKALGTSTQEEVTALNTEIETALGRPFNTKSNLDKSWLLYEHLQYKPMARRVTAGGKPKTDEDTLLHYWLKNHDPVVRLVIRCTRKRTRLSDIYKLIPNPDGRIRTSLDIVGTNTGRLASRASSALQFDDKEQEWVNTGTNLQNVTRELRVCFIPDSDDYEFAQFDLSGADGWTVSADLAAIGHTAMLDDYQAGIKPALVLYYMLQEHAAGRSPGDVNKLDRTALKEVVRQMREHIDSLEGKTDSQGRPLDWQYLCCKRAQHGSNYGMLPERLAEVIFGDSDGTIALDKSTAQLYQYFYKLRYNTDSRNERIRKVLSETGALVAACGIRRQFFSIRKRYAVDDDTVREASAFDPQANTTWATNKALERLWYDKANRNSHGGLFVEPILQIHDALVVQYKVRDRAWAHTKLNEWFQNPLNIFGHTITIPAEGKWGRSWKDCKNSI